MVYQFDSLTSDSGDIPFCYNLGSPVSGTMSTRCHRYHAVGAAVGAREFDFAGKCTVNI